MRKSPRAYPGPLQICILAGGRSSRMGKEKARLRIGNRTLLGRVKAAAVASGLPFRVLRRDLVPRCGPIGGVYSALATARAGAVLFLACDMPFVSTALLLRVAAAHKRVGRAVFVEHGGQRGFPCIIPTACLATIQEQIARKEWSMQRLSQVLRARVIRMPKRRAVELFNVNTAEDLIKARQLLHGCNEGRQRDRRR